MTKSHHTYSKNQLRLREAAVKHGTLKILFIKNTDPTKLNLYKLSN